MQEITECGFTSVEDNDCTKTPCVKKVKILIYLLISVMPTLVEAPVNIVLTSTSSSSVEANWTQPSSADSVWQYYTNHTITCTSTHGVYTATKHVNVSAAVNESMHAIITGLVATPLTTAVCPLSTERSEDVCGYVITGLWSK